MPIKRITETAASYAGNWDTKSGPANLKNEDVTVSENMRISPEGGRFTRMGFERQCDLGTSAKVDTLRSFDMHGVLFAKSGTKVFQSTDPDSLGPYDIGLTQTASERTFLYPYGKQMFAVNQTDSAVRCVVSTLATALTAGSTEVVVRAGDGAFFDASGAKTIYIDGDEIDYNGVSTDTLGSVTNIATSHAVGAVVTQTSTPSGFPKGSCMSDLENRLLVGGVNANPKILYYSAPETTANPEFIYDFSANGAGSKEMPGDITALFKGIGIVLIGMKNAISYAYTFNVDTGALLTRDLTQEHGIPNPFCICQLGPRYYAFTGKRVIPIAVDQSGAQLLDNPDQPWTAFDYRLRGELAQADADQTYSFLVSNPIENEITLCMAQSGLYYEFVWDGDTAKWASKDDKNFSCSTIFKQRRYAGSDTNAYIHLDGEGLVDDSVPVSHRIVSKEYNQQGKSMVFRKFTFSGLLSATGSFTFRLYLNGTLELTREVTAQSLIDQGLLSLASGTPIGSGQIGGTSVGSGGDAPTGYAFTYPLTLKYQGEFIQFEWEVTDEGSVFQLDDSELIYEMTGSSLLPSQ